MSNIDFSDLDNLFEGLEEQPVIEKEENEKKPKAKETVQVAEAPSGAAAIGLLQSGQAKMDRIGVEMNNLFVERDQLVKLMQLALVTGTNLLMLGPPGTARVDIIA